MKKKRRRRNGNGTEETCDGERYQSNGKDVVGLGGRFSSEPIRVDTAEVRACGHISV